MHKYRVSAVCPLALVVVSFVLSILLVLGGRKPGNLEEEYMLALDVSRVGQDIIRFEAATATSSAAPSATTSSSSNPMDLLNPFSTSSPLNPNNPDNPFVPLLGNLTDSVGNGLQNAINDVVEAIVDEAGVRDFYYLYLNKVCEGDITDGTGANEDGVKVDTCLSYEDASKNASGPGIPSSVVIGTTNISVPLIANLSHTIDSLTSSISPFRRTNLAFLIISLVGSGISFLLTLPSIFFPQSHLLIYANLFFILIASTFAFLAAVLVTALIVAIAQVLGGTGEVLNLFVKKGGSVLAFAWVAWVCVAMGSAYWGAVWFVEVRGWSFVRRKRTEGEVGNWRGMLGEVGRDLKGKKNL